MAKLSVQYVCTECGASSAKWMGRCSSCGRWQTMQEEVVASGAPAAERAAKAVLAGSAKPQKLEDIKAEDAARVSTGLDELDRVLGGGLVPGSLVLLSGDPGIGKSTLILQASRHLAAAGLRVLYASGEESPQQIALRARRLGEFKGEFLLLSETRWESLAAQVERENPAVLVVDSIQTMESADLPSSAGSVSQVRECAARIMALAKAGIPMDPGTSLGGLRPPASARNLIAIIIGHVTKDGSLAGPRTLEHLVDVVLAFEGEKHQAMRMVRPVKNRFGSTEELGLFEMAGDGLRELSQPSEYFMKSRLEGSSGSVAYVSMEGSRPMLAELQALVAPTHFGTPQRSSSGLDPWRLNLLYAVLEKRCGVNLYNQDCFVSVAGGLRLAEPSVDLAVACAVVSSLRAKAVPQDWAVFGEIGLGGELRPAPQAEARLREAKRLGFKKALLAREEPKAMERLKATGIELVFCRTLEEALRELNDA